MKRKAYTLWELLAYLATIFILLAIIIPGCNRIQGRMPRINGRILKMEVVPGDPSYRYPQPAYKITVLETNAYEVPKDYFDHLTEGQYIYHE